MFFLERTRFDGASAADGDYFAEVSGGVEVAAEEGAASAAAAVERDGFAFGYDAIAAAVEAAHDAGESGCATAFFAEAVVAAPEGIALFIQRTRGVETGRDEKKALTFIRRAYCSGGFCDGCAAHTAKKLFMAFFRALGHAELVRPARDGHAARAGDGARVVEAYAIEAEIGFRADFEKFFQHLGRGGGELETEKPLPSFLSLMYRAGSRTLIL